MASWAESNWGREMKGFIDSVKSASVGENVWVSSAKPMTVDIQFIPDGSFQLVGGASFDLAGDKKNFRIVIENALQMSRIRAEIRDIF